MKIKCPVCGTRDNREFYYIGSADFLNRPKEGGDAAAWDDYVHNRDNPPGVTEELWCHELGCGSWVVVTRNVSTHGILTTRLAKEAEA